MLRTGQGRNWSSSLAAAPERDLGNVAIIAALKTELLSAGEGPTGGPTSVDILTQARRDRQEQLMDCGRGGEAYVVLAEDLQTDPGHGIRQTRPHRHRLLPGRAHRLTTDSM